jgi:hypothetical protein
VLFLEHVHLGVGEIREAPRAVEIQVRRHDVMHVLAAKTEPLDLRHRGLLQREGRRVLRKEATPEATGISDVAGADPGVDQHEPVRRLDDEAMAYHPRAREEPSLPQNEPLAARAERPAVRDLSRSQGS